MPRVYHTVPVDMVGTVLYPLNQLSAAAPEQYALQRAKYAGREAVLDFRIPSLNLLFNDTVHCSPLHPYHLLQARKDLGLPVPARPRGPSWTGLVYPIPLERIIIHSVIWYSWKTPWINGYPNDDVPMEPPTDEFEPFDPDCYHEMTAPTQGHLLYLATMQAQGRPSLMFVHIPHVLVAGPIDVSGLEPIPWNEPPT